MSFSQAILSWQEVIVGNRLHWVVLIGCLILSLGLGVWASEPTISYEERTQDGVRDLIVTTPLSNVVLSENGGVVRSVLLTFTPYGTDLAEIVYGTNPDPDTYLRSYKVGPEFAIPAEFPFTLMRFEQDGQDPVAVDGQYTMSDPVIDDDGVLTVEFTGAFSGYAVRKTYTFDPAALYTIGFDIELEPVAAETDELHLLFSKIIPSTVEREPVYLFNGSPSGVIYQGFSAFGGIGYRDGDVVSFLIPESHATLTPFAKPIAYVDPSSRDADKCWGYCGRYGVVLDGSDDAVTYRFTLYAGRRRFVTLEAAGIEALDETGFFARLMVYVIRFLNWLYRYTGNYGWAIIIFTIVMRVILFPLMRKQYHSMARIQQIQPRLKRIQEKYKDNKEEMQKRILEVYRKEKVNPMSGCFPMAVQLPIIVIIWRALLYASELIHLSPGFLWIPDLSLHDPYFILVILTTLVMIAQQHFMSPMTAEAAGPQKYMGYFFPLLMAFLLWRFPAGLWLYYLLTTALQVGQQAFVNWEMARATAGQATVPVDDDFVDIDSSTDVETSAKSDDEDTT